MKMSDKLGRQRGQEDMPSEGTNRNTRNAATAPKGRGYTIYWKYVTDNRMRFPTVIL